MGVSRTVIREAVKVLASSGIVRFGRSGIYVAGEDFLLPWLMHDHTSAIDPEQILSLFEFRRIQEMHTAQLAADRITPRELHTLEVAVQQSYLTAEAGQWTLFREADSTFHQAIAMHTQSISDVRDCHSISPTALGNGHRR
jgi:DNA-binding FadR family transcriptional regulator